MTFILWTESESEFVHFIRFCNNYARRLVVKVSWFACNTRVIVDASLDPPVCQIAVTKV